MKTLDIPRSIKDLEQKTPGPCELSSECYETHKGEISPNPYKFFHRGDFNSSQTIMRPAFQNTKTG